MRQCGGAARALVHVRQYRAELRQIDAWRVQLQTRDGSGAAEQGVPWQHQPRARGDQHRTVVDRQGQPVQYQCRLRPQRGFGRCAERQYQAGLARLGAQYAGEAFRLQQQIHGHECSQHDRSHKGGDCDQCQAGASLHDGIVTRSWVNAECGTDNADSRRQWRFTFACPGPQTRRPARQPGNLVAAPFSCQSVVSSDSGSRPSTNALASNGRKSSMFSPKPT